MSLDQLSSDCLNGIAFYLEASTLGALLACGNSLLNAKIRLLNLDLRFLIRPFQKFPFFVFKLPNLRGLTVKDPSGKGNYPLKLETSLPLPTTPVKTLHKLELRFIRCWSVLALEHGVPLLDATCPNLKVLSLFDNATRFTEEHMEAIPRGLEVLRLSTRHEHPSRLPCAALKYLPPSLHSLALEAVSHIIVDSDRRDYSTITWPSNLRTLELTCVEPCMLDHLPPNIERLTLRLRSDRSHWLPVSLVLPRTLKEISIGGMARCGVSIQPKSLPPQLELCDAELSFEGFSPTDFPKSITSIDCIHDIQQHGNITDILPNITELDGIYSRLDFPPELLSNLPSRLVSIGSASVSVADIPYFPATLKEIGLKVRPSASMTSNSASSPSEVVTPCDMARLPRNLGCLHLFNAQPGSKFSRSDFDALPPHLHDMTFSMEDIESADVLLGIPRSVDFIAIDFGEECDPSLVSDFQLLDRLPSGLKMLVIDLTPNIRAWAQWMSRLHQFPALEMLQVQFYSLSTSSESVTLDFIYSLPGTITDLYLPMEHTKLLPEQMMRLPKKLTHLCFLSNSSDNAATDQCFSNLPPSITALSLPDDIQGLTPELFMLVPPSLVSFVVPEYLEEARMDHLDSQADWGEYTPFYP
jgi:hypothetical protein